MPKTTNLGLELTNDNSTTFKDWREKINGVGDGDTIPKSNMQLIDEFAGSVNTILGDIDTALSNILGV
jgi:hypothetical protein